jgi:aldose sugar dehydrogenase
MKVGAVAVLIGAASVATTSLMAGQAAPATPGAPQGAPQGAPPGPPRAGGAFVPPGGGPEEGLNTRPPNAPNQKPAVVGQTRAPERKASVAFDVVTVAEGLESPWGMAFLPDGRMLVTEKAGRLRIVTADGKLSPPVAGLPMVDARTQAGLLDVALDPAFQKNRLIYWSFSEPRGDAGNNTAVARGTLVDGAAPRVDNVQVIYHQTPYKQDAAQLHFGSRLVFGRDGTLFVTQGERSDTATRMQAQKLDVLFGKIVRINPDGSIPKDNPFVGRQDARPEIWSYGHRNVQAAALNPATGELWEVEHGTRGGDEVNIARKGKDYGWPTIAYGIEYQGPPITGGIQQQAGMEQPVYYWDPNIAPSGMAFYTGSLFPGWRNSLFIGGLASTNLVRLTLDGDKVVGEERLLQDLKPTRERIRDVRQGPDGAVYLLTDNPKGRMLKLVPKK